MKKDFLIIGQGLAGSFLAWSLLQRNASLILVDDNHSHCSSFAAAGMINPVTGKRLVLSARCQELLPFARTFYQKMEYYFEKKIFETKDIIRLFKDEKELQEWERKRLVTHLKKYYGNKQHSGTYHPTLNDACGSFIIKEGGYCRTGELMECLSAYFYSKKCLLKQRFDHAELVINSHSVCWRGDTFDQVIFCEGFQAKDNPFFDWLPYNLAKGEILTLVPQDKYPLSQRLPGLPDAVISCGKWCIPLGERQYTAGSTYSWDQFDCTVTEQGKHEILSSIGKFIKVPFDVIAHAAGVRPIVKDLKPVMGLHPQHERVALFNGLASKGLLWGPFYSEQMADFLLAGKTLELEVDVQRFVAKHYLTKGRS